MSGTKNKPRKYNYERGRKREQKEITDKLGKKRKQMKKDCDICGKWNSAHQVGFNGEHICDDCIEERREY